MKIGPFILSLIVLHAPAAASAQFVLDVPSLASNTQTATSTTPVTAPCSVQGAGEHCAVALNGARTQLTITGCDGDLGIGAQELQPTPLQVSCGQTPTQVDWPSMTTATVNVPTAGAVQVGTSNVPPNALFLCRSDGAWRSVAAAAQDVLRNHLQPCVYALYSADGRTGWAVATISSAAAPSVAQEGRRREDTTATCSSSDIEAQCREQAQRLGVSAYACFVNDPGSSDLRLVRLVPSGHVLAPNTSFGVVVLHPSDRSIEASLSGTIATTEPTIDRQEVSTRASSCTWTRASFGPRRAGEALELEVELHGGLATDDEKIELVVEQRYWGAIRVGVGVPFLAVDRAYTVERIGASMQHEIVSSGSVVDVELIAAFAAFFETGGRNYLDGNLGKRFGVFTAAGVLAASERGAQFLTSIYLGFEWEPFRSFTIGIAAVLRRVDRLSPNFRIGDAVDEDATVSGERWEPGIALVLCVSPDFLQFTGGIQ